jgi:catechol 2,3-dioxygenase-like lactoylglutathione lyase family enzyme
MFALHLLKVPAADPAAAEPFWTALLGRPPVARGAGGARYHVDGIDLALEPAAAAAAELGFELDHDDLEALLARLPGGTVAAIETAADGGRCLLARDPSGHPVRVRWRMPER